MEQCTIANIESIADFQWGMICVVENLCRRFQLVLTLSLETTRIAHSSSRIDYTIDS